MPVKVSGDSLLIYEFTCSLFIGLCSVTSDLTGYSHSYHSIKLIHCGAPQRDVLSVLFIKYCYKLSIQRQTVVTDIFYFILCQSFILSTVISFVYKDKLWFDENMSVIFCMENT